MAGLKLDKAAGPDGFSNRIIAWPVVSQIVPNIFQDSLDLSYISSSWCRAQALIIPKPGKTNYTTMGAWRTLSLSSCWLKLLERAVHTHLLVDVKIDEHLDQNQYGFRAGRSTHEAIHHLVSRIESKLAEGEYALGYFLDIQGAFDNVSIEAILRALDSTPISPIVKAWIKDLLGRRTAIFSLKGLDLLRYLLKGTPQGGILSPLLWNLVCNNFDFVHEHYCVFYDDSVDC